MSVGDHPVRRALGAWAVTAIVGALGWLAAAAFAPRPWGLLFGLGAYLLLSTGGGALWAIAIHDLGGNGE